LLLYTHCVIAFTCVGLNLIALEQRSELDWRLHDWLRQFSATPIGVMAWVLCLASCFGFPAAFASGVGRSPPEWRG
jgi:hypothetical protein